MNRYLGETDVTHEHQCEPVEMALLYIEMYGGIDGAHHKDWVLDQVARILNGAPVTVKQAAWDNGHTELRYTVGECNRYHQWVNRICNDGEYDYDEGIAP